MMKTFMTYVFAAALLVGTAGATDVAAQTDQWNGLMLNATGIGPTAGNFQIDVTEYSSQEEVDEYIRILRDDGPRRLEGALNGNRHGSIRMNGLPRAFQYRICRPSTATLETGDTSRSLASFGGFNATTRPTTSSTYRVEAPAGDST